MHCEMVSFPGANGATLAASHSCPEGAARASAIVAHCFTCSEDIAAARPIAGRLAALGVAVLRFDFTDLGHSGGEFANSNLSSDVAGLLAAASWMQAQRMPAQLLIDHSLGNAAALKAAQDIDTLKAVVRIGPPAEPAHFTRNFGRKLDEIRDKESAIVSLAERDTEIRKQFLDDISQASLADALDRLRGTLLIFHGPRDAVVGIENASIIFMAAWHPQIFVSIDDADHLIRSDTDAEHAVDLISGWPSRYLGIAPKAVRRDAPEGVVRLAKAKASGVPSGYRHQRLASTDGGRTCCDRRYKTGASPVSISTCRTL
jgi:putative redox protein